MLRLLKVLHTLGAIGLMGGLMVCLVLVGRPAPGPAATEALRHALDAVFVWGLVPSMLVCVVSGFASWMVHRPFRNALWASLKGVSGLSVMEVTLHLQSQAREATALAVQAVAGAPQPLAWAEVRHTEEVLVWVLLVLSFLNIVLGVWRPRFSFIRGLPQSS
jgi:hypothetical protein